jgi:outer membrane beta-barrel protein
VNRLLHLTAAFALVFAADLARAEDDDILGGIEEKAPAKPPPTEEAPAAEEIEAAPAPEPAAQPAAAAAPKATESTAADASALDRVKAVQRKPVMKRLRAEVTPMASASLNDAFYTHYAAGLGLVFYPHDNFAFGVSGLWLIGHPRSDNVEVVREGQTSVPATFEQPMIFGTVDLYWIPIYGKVSLFDSSIFHFDFYITTGFGVVRFEEGDRMPGAASAGLGQRFMISDWLALRLELRDYLFLDTQEVAGQPRSDVQSYLMFQGGVSFFLPPSDGGL